MPSSCLSENWDSLLSMRNTKPPSISKELLDGKGAWRVHGGGFAGTIQAFVPNDMLDTYKKTIEGVFGEGSCHVLIIRPVGGTQVI